MNRNKKSCIGNLFYVSPAADVLMYYDRIESEMKDWRIPPILLSFTPSKLENSCCVSISTILILLVLYKHQASSFRCEGKFSISKKCSCNHYDKNRRPMIFNDFFTESPRVSSCNCFDFSSTRLEESSFLLFVGSIFLFSVDFFVDLRFDNE